MWKKITRKQAMELMGDHADEIVFGEKAMLTYCQRPIDVSYCIPSTGKSLWGHRQGCIFIYKVEE
jgi:hypothetical protein